MFPSWNARAVGLDMTAETAVETAAAAKFTGVDLLVRDLVENGTVPLVLRRRMDDLGVRGGAWPLPVRWRGDATQYEDDLRRLPRYAHAASVLGLQPTGTWVLPEVDPKLLPPGTPHAELPRRTLDLHRERLGRIAQILDEHGCQLGLEIMGPATERSGRHAAFITRYAELGALLDLLHREHANVGVLADAFHLFAAGEHVSTAGVWREGAIVWTHLADPAHADRQRLRDRERVLPGERGLGECRRLLHWLLELGYDGPVTAEPLGLSPDIRGLPALSIAQRARDALESVWPVLPRQTPTSTRGDCCTR